MKRTRDLKGIACGLAETFISRNNDVSGYWGIGMLYREALEHSASIVDIDLMGVQLQPGGPISQAVATYYSAYLASRLGELRLNAARVSHCRNWPNICCCSGGA